MKIKVSQIFHAMQYDKRLVQLAVLVIPGDILFNKHASEIFQYRLEQ